MAVISKDIKLSYKKDGSTTAYTELENLQQIPDLGGSTESIEITTLADGAHKYTDGIKDYGDSLEFTFLYEKEQFAALNALSGSISWKVTLPDDSSCTFSGSSNVTLVGVGVNEALTYTLSIRPDSEMVWA